VIMQRPPKPKPAPRHGSAVSAGMQRALARARSWAGTPTSCGTCSKVRAVASRVLGVAKR